uniref:TF-B3 domain-containing protein n=1 Tax=Kalanchoe fedtschenkoi TaxID=63787 RepID=A0A7N0VMR6_KALFE
MVQPEYEQSRQKRLEENRKRMEALNLPQLSQALRQFSPGLTTPPMKQRKPRAVEKKMVPVRRSDRLSDKPGPVYLEVDVDRYDRVTIPRRVSKARDLSNQVYASEEERSYSIKKAEEVQAALDATHPSFVKPMLPSHVSGGFWLGLNVSFCKRHLPNRDSEVTLIDEDDEEYPTVYLPRKTGLSGGWKGFAVAHDLTDGDALVFQLIKPTAFKVYITRASGFKKTAA